MNNKLYAVRDKETGKLVSYLTSPNRRFWESKRWAEKAIEEYNCRTVRRKHGRFELVCFELVEVKE